MNSSTFIESNRSGLILQEILGGDKQDFRFAVAYARNSGVNLLKNPMREFLDRGGAIQGIVGVNQGSTSYQGLNSLADIIGDNLYLRCVRKGGGIFHPKLYCFSSIAGEFAPTTAIIGSSNLTRGGLQNNEECNILLENVDTYSDLSKSIQNFWDSMRVSNHFTTVQATSDILNDLLECGALVDETARAKKDKSSKPSIDIEKELSRILGIASSSQHQFFAMTLSEFDVSPRSADPVILIPIRARNMNMKFWFWPNFYVRERKLADLYLEATIKIDSKTSMEQLRLYDYPAKSEFRLKSSLIKRNGKKGDILLIERAQEGMLLSLIRKQDQQYDRYHTLLTETVSDKKIFGYFDKI